MFFLNPSFDVNFKPQPPARLPLEFHKRLPNYKPTPLHSLPAFAEQFGIGKLFVKDESSRLELPAFKILGASWATYRALVERFPDRTKNWANVEELAKNLKSCRSLVLYSATDGNHGRAVAHTARMFGLRACIYVPRGTAEARISAIESEGATVKVVEGTYDNASERASSDAAAVNGLLIQDNGWAGYETIPRYVIEGYSTMLWEIDEALVAMKEQQPTHIVVQVGVGSLADAVVRHYRTINSSVIIIGVEPDSAAGALESVRAGKIVKVPGPHRSIMAGMNCDSVSLVSWQALLKGINCYISISDDRAREAMRIFASHGIVSGETGVAGLGGLMELLRNNKSLNLEKNSRVFLISTEGATDPVSYKNIVG